MAPWKSASFPYDLILEIPYDVKVENNSFDRLNFDHFHVVVYFKNQRLGLATPLDLVSNDRPPRSSAPSFAE